MSLKQAVQMEIGDHEGSGIMPDGSNVSDEMLQHAAGAELVTDMTTPTDREVGRVAAKVLELVAAAWRTQPYASVTGPVEEENNTYNRLMQEAARLRRKWGYGGNDPVAEGRTGSIPGYASAGAYVLPPGI